MCCTSRMGPVIAVVLGMLSVACPSWSEDGSRMGYREGKEIVFRPGGVSVRMDALDPSVRKWYVPQELFPEYQWRQWSTTNYARQWYKRYHDFYYQYFYDDFGNYLGYGFLVYDWRQVQPRILGSKIWGGTHLGSLYIASDVKGAYRYALSIGRRIYTVLTPLTFSKPAFDGAKLDFLSDRCEATLLLSRITLPFGGYRGPIERTYANNLVGGHAAVKLADGVKVGGTYVNAHQRNTSSEPFSGNPFAGELTGPQNRDLRWITIRVSDDSPEDGVGGAVFFFQEVQITRTDGAVVRGDDVGLDPVIEGGVQGIGFLAADGSERITLTYDFTVPTYTGPRPYEIRRLRFTLGLANDYRVEISSDLQTNRNNRAVFLTVARASGNVRDHSNRRLVSFDYGLSTADEVIGVNVEVEDLAGFSMMGELAASRQYRQWPNKVQKRHHTFTYGGTAMYVNLAYRRYPWLLFVEAFDIGWAYRTANLMADAGGRLDYEDVVGTQYEFVDDNDDLDRYPDWRRPPNGEPDPAVFPGYDENGDFISDFNQNDNIFRRNRIPDYEEPFLRYGCDRPEYLFGMDMNNNGVIDRFENDEFPDYPYKRDHRGYNLYLGRFFGPEVRVVLGQEREDLVSRGMRNLTTYGVFALDRSYPNGVRVQIFEHMKLCKDRIPDDLFQWTQKVGMEPELREVRDALAFRNTWANVAFLGYEYRRPFDFNFVNRVKVEVFHQRDGEGALEERGVRRRSYLFGVLTKMDYVYEVGALRIWPRWKSEYFVRKPYVRGNPMRRELRETVSLIVRTGFARRHKGRVFKRTTLEGGVEVTAFDQLQDPAPEGVEKDFFGTAFVGQFTSYTAHLGYRVISQLGYRMNRQAYRRGPARTSGTVFCTVMAGIQE